MINRMHDITYDSPHFKAKTDPIQWDIPESTQDGTKSFNIYLESLEGGSKQKNSQHSSV